MKNKQSLPVALLQAADAAAEDIGISRRRLVQLALAHFLQQQREGSLTRYGGGLREEGGGWRTRDHNRRQGDGRSRKTAISLPASLIEDVKAAAKDLGMSRSKLFETALESFLRQGKENAIKVALNRYSAEQGDLSEEDEVLLEHARQMTRRVEWK